MNKTLVKTILSLLIALSFAIISACGNSIVSDTSATLLSVGNTDVPLGEALVLIMGYRDNADNTYESNIWDVNLGDNSFGEYFQDKVKEQVALVYVGSALANKKGTKLTSDDEKLIKSASDYFSANLSSSDKNILGINDDNIYKLFYSYRIAIQCYKDLVSGADVEVSKDEARVINLSQIKISKEGLSDADVSIKKSKIEEAHTKAAAGEDFSSLVSKYNEVPESNIIVTRSDLEPKEEDAAFNLNQDEISTIIETDKAFVIYKCTNSYNESLSVSNRQKMIKDKKDKEYLISLNGYLSNHPLDWNEEMWDEINISNLTYKTSISFFDVYNMFFAE